MAEDSEFTNLAARFHRQILLPGIGDAGQRALQESRALVVGCGALGTVIAELLARAGIGGLTIVDRDVVELTNLQRQILFDENDVERGMPKAIAAREKIAQINRNVDVQAHADDFNARNAEQYARGIDLILDGLDNFETRYLLNDLAVHIGLPFVYGGAVGTTGMSFTILPHAAKRINDKKQTRRIAWTDEQATPCLRCIFPDPPPPGSTPTCDTAGVLSSAVMTVASHQVAQAIKLMTGNLDALDRSMLSLDVWRNDTQRFDVGTAREHGDCACCVHGRFEYLEGNAAGGATSLCGRNAVQINPSATNAAASAAVDLPQLASRLSSHGAFVVNEILLRGELGSERGRNGEPIELTVFRNGRAIIKGTSEPEHARSIYAKYIGA